MFDAGIPLLLKSFGIIMIISHLSFIKLKIGNNEFKLNLSKKLKRA